MAASGGPVRPHAARCAASLAARSAEPTCPARRGRGTPRSARGLGVEGSSGTMGAAAVLDLRGPRPRGGAAVPQTTPGGAEPAPEIHADWTPPSWDEVVRTHSARVYRLAYRLTGNPHDAEDLTQDVFVRVFRSLSTYTPGTFEGWLHRITTNLFLDQVRRKQRIRFDGLADDAAERLPGREPGPAQVYDDTHFDDDVQRALDALPPDFRAAVVLCDIEGLSYEEIAATLGIKLGGVRRGAVGPWTRRARAGPRQAFALRAPSGEVVAPTTACRPARPRARGDPG